MSDTKKVRSTTASVVAQIPALMAEFKASGLAIDDFMRRKLKESRPDGEQCAERMLRTFSEIDANYADIQQARARGVNRQDWLRDKIEESIANAHADKKRDMVGDVLGRSLDAMKGGNTNQPKTVPFEGMDAVEMVGAIEESLVDDAIASTVTGSAREEL